MPEPAIPVAASMGIGLEQQFDALALIQEITAVANGGVTSTSQWRVRCTITLIDGSRKEDNDKVCLLPVTIFANEGMGGQPQAFFQQLQLAASNKWALAVCSWYS